MTNNQEELFEELEKLNAQMDTRIDDEEYKSIWGDKGIITLSNNAKSKVRKCFPDDNGHWTHDKDKEWREALGFAKDTLPVVQVSSKDLKEHKKDPTVGDWSHLFYAKLLRAKIKQKGSDCYTRRLDDVVAYLEGHLPQRTNGIKPEQKEWVTRLRLMYLLELSAASQDWESLGFAERARRVITNAKHSLAQSYKDKNDEAAKAHENAPYEFYDLWAHYNIGVAYFHQAYYRKAILEFNWIIWQVEKWQKDSSKFEESLKFFKESHYGIALLYLPAILYRAEVQLKLQFAYHTLDTLNKYFWNNEKITSQKKIHAMLIKAQAYQQMGPFLDKSWAILNKDVCSRLECGQLGERAGCTIPECDRLNQRFPGLGERFLDILIADHLEWLTLEGEDEGINQEDDLELRYIAKHGKTKKGDIATAKDYEEAGGEASSYLNKLIKIFSTYHDVVKHHAYNRSGYLQQLAKYLGWLAKVADFKYSDPAFAHRKGVESARKQIADIAKKLYDDNKDGLLEEEPGLGDEGEKEESECLYCDPKGIDLRRIESEHYTWFTDDMLVFFNSESIRETNQQQRKEDKIEENKRKFVRRLIKLEWKGRDDLRIHDLKLRYEYYGKKELLGELLKDDKNEEERQSSPHEKCAEWLCWREQENQAESLGLPICRNNENQKKGDLTSGDYIKIMQGWNEDYLRQLQSPSIHENQKGGFYFMGLQRWNSASPAKGFSVGGGYLLYHLNKESKKVDMGIAIDPGFDFVRNLFHMGFSLNDIDIVLISHAHPDHIRDFESIVMLLSELKKRGKQEKRVHVILSLGAYKRLEHIVKDPGFRYFVEPYIIDVDREIAVNSFEEGMQRIPFRLVNNGGHGNLTNTERLRAVLPEEDKQNYNGFQVTITPTRAYHDDKTRSDSFGFLIDLKGEEKENEMTFGYTGDTKWVYPNMPDPLNEEGESKDKREKRKIEEIAEQYSKCDVLLVHLGSLIKKDNDGEWSFDQYDQCGRNENGYKCEELVRENDHPYLIGMLRLLSSYYNCASGGEGKDKSLVLVSEFGEELRGTIRSAFIQRLQEIYKNKLAFLPVDVGMDVYLHKKGDEQDQSRGNRCACKVWCVQCNHFVNIGDADFELYGTDHALYCVCKTCRKATPTNVLQDRLRQLYEVGIELRTNGNK